MTVTIRSANCEDAAAITAVFLASRSAALPYLPRLHDDQQTGAWITRVVLVQCRVWVAYDATQQIRGFIAVRGRRLEHLYLDPGHRRRGIGTRLLEQARLASPDGLTLRVFTRNTDARTFYERHGFRVLDQDDGTRNEENEPDMTYAWTGTG